MFVEIILVVVALVCVLLFLTKSKDNRGSDRKEDHKSGTRYDDPGYDVAGYDRCGYDHEGYDQNGYNRDGYDRTGRNCKGQYNRLFDVEIYKTSQYSADGFLDPRYYPVIVTDHARQRISERLLGGEKTGIVRAAQEAYCFGKSKRQIRRSSSGLVEEIESRYDGSVVLIYHGYIYVFSEDNKLITMYKNERIPL